MRPEFLSPAAIFALFFLAAYAAFSNPLPAAAGICGEWGEAKKTGTLDHLRIDEASGVAVSTKFPGRLYHINDSGGGPYFYITDTAGGNTRAVRIEGYDSKRLDFEDMSIGECAPGRSCVFIADIGDNRKRRDYTEIIAVEEIEDFAGAVKPLKRVKIAYPDGPRNAEALAVHPGGDIFILTKEEKRDYTEAYPARLYRLPRDKWRNAGEGVLKPEYVGEIDFPSLLPGASPLGQVVTSFDIAPDGKKFIVLTYEKAVEFGIDLSAGDLKPAAKMEEGKDYRVIEVMPLPQQESIAYVDGGSGFIYDTEHHLFEVPIMRVGCVGGE
ncbi:MAG TPA: hypothetical protein PKC29_05620 [Thermodesulfobacteriota bacterium]|nr:hypothetical protein [Thermodesulfobacteriota bacterium]